MCRRDSVLGDRGVNIVCDSDGDGAAGKRAGEYDIVIRGRVVGAEIFQKITVTDEPFAVVFAAMGITFEESNFFIESFKETGAIDRTCLLYTSSCFILLQKPKSATGL